MLENVKLDWLKTMWSSNPKLQEGVNLKKRKLPKNALEKYRSFPKGGCAKKKMSFVYQNDFLSKSVDQIDLL